MLYMVIEYFNAGALLFIAVLVTEVINYHPVLKYGRWLDLEYFRCFQLMRADDRSLFDIWIQAWYSTALYVC